MIDYFGEHLEGLLALLIALGTLVGLFVTKKTRATTRAHTENVDAGVLAQFKELFERLVKVEADLKAARLTIEQLRTEIQGMRKVEEFLEAKIHERESVIRGLTDELASARRRIDHLEEVCRRAGINGDDFS